MSDYRRLMSVWIASQYQTCWPLSPWIAPIFSCAVYNFTKGNHSTSLCSFFNFMKEQKISKGHSNQIHQSGAWRC